MKKSFLIIATVVFTICNLQATNSLKENPITNLKFNKNKVVKIYDWKLELENGTFSGTSLSMEDAQKAVTLISKGEFVLQKQITSYYVLLSDTHTSNYRMYYWEVKSESGYAKGFASTKEKAEKLINLVAKGDILTYKIIERNKK